ncbi:MAG: hypothetical protein HXY28_14965 [Hydrogenophilaceae bacterium]|nr:hypothetical protein [Hydrogenophilaceae bacterium]
MKLLHVLFVAAALGALSPASALADTLYIDPAAPGWVHALAAAALYSHIGGGLVGLVSGAAALVFRKGSRLHRAAGVVFVVAMTVMAGVAAPVSVMMGDRVNVLAALFTLYLLATAVVTVRRRADGVGLFERGAFVAALALAATTWTFIVLAMNSPTGTLDGAPPMAFFIFGVITPMAAALDLNMILRRGVAGARRIARHLWRMCFGLFIASGSLFLGQMQVFPEPMREIIFLAPPAFAPLVALIYWLVRVRLRPGRPAPQAA